MRRLWLLLIAVVFAGGAVVAGCGDYNDDRGLGDVKPEQQSIDGQDEKVYVWPSADKFPNIAAFCIGGNGVYSTTRPAPPVVVTDDPECAEGGALDYGDD